MRMRRGLVLSTAVAATVASARVWAQDQLTTVVSSTNAVGGVTTPPALGTFGYDPVNNRIYVAGFSGADQQLRRIDNVDGTQTVQTQVFSTAWSKFDKTDLNNGGGAPTPSALLLNPKPIAALGIGSYSSAWIIDIDSTVMTGTGTTAVSHPELTKRIYTYNLQQSNIANGDASDVFTPQLTLDQFRVAAGSPSTGSLTTNIGRQFAWSGDGQSFYFVDITTSTNYAGIWKMPAAGGTPTKLLTATADMNTEPAVISSGGVDTIYFRGGASTSNAGGFDKITYDGTTASARTVAVPASAVNSFFELTSGSIQTASMCTDAAGNLYFNDTSGNRTGIYCYDTQGRFFKVVSRAERQAAFGASASTNTLRMQPRTVTYTNGSISFPVTQILYAETTPINLIAGAYVFKPGDFNRDNMVDQQDVALFKSALTVKGVAATTANLKYDMNGNGEVSYGDVKAFQSFYGFANGDANMDGTVNALDFNAVATNYGNVSPVRWTEGDFTGDQLVTTADFTIMANNFGVVAPPPGPGPVLAGAALGSVVPEPAALGIIFASTTLLYRKRR
jgi:hypothetical protein